MMAGRLQLLIILSLLRFTQPFELREDEWEELSPDIVALHCLQGLSEHMFHECITSDTSRGGFRVEGSTGRMDDEQNPKSWQKAQEDTETFKQYADSFLANINKQKTDNWLITASEISHSYSHKLLVMMDKEKSTQDRIQQEYSQDPHYSTVVSRECLDDESCLPEADGCTVVKIFGNVSQNGQTVSGLSGESLAGLILKPSLKEAPVFSIDGNTTAEFKHSFMRVFIVRGSNAVLETNHNNHHIYQVMDQLDSVSSYRIPQMLVDHSTQYDHQQILMLQDDPVIKNAATNLYEKHPSVSSVYVLDNNQKPKLIHGESVPLSEDSQLVLVGHGARDSGGEMRLAGYKPEDVAKIIQSTSRVGDKIKTTSLVGSEVGADRTFVTTLLKEIHDVVGIQTELHLRAAVLQVTHTGQKITQEISRDGPQWLHKDNSKKVVAMLDRNGNVIIRNDLGSKGEAVFTNEKNFLGPKSGMDSWNQEDPVLNYRKNWPQEPKRFIDPKVFEKFHQNQVTQIKHACDDLEGLSWGIFHSDAPPNELNVINEPLNKNKYLIGEKDGNNMRWINDEKKLQEILHKCYKIESGKDVRNGIRHYAKKGEDESTYLMVNDWIYEVDPKYLYVYPVGKKLDNNQIGNMDKINKVKKSITDQIGKADYPAIRENMEALTQDNVKQNYAQYVNDIFRGERTTFPEVSVEAWYTTYFTASVICESARNFRTFPLVLMALDMIGRNNNNIRQTGLDFLFDQHSMARGGSWIDPSRRGFYGSATPEHSSKLKNKNPKYRKTKEQLMNDLEKLITRETKMFRKWEKTVSSSVQERMSETVSKYRIFEDKSDMTVFNKDYKKFKVTVEQQRSILKPPGHDGNPPASGTLGGSKDGDVTMRDLNSASELENSFKQESYFSRASAAFKEEIHVQLKAKFGQQLSGMHLKEGTARIEDGEFVCQLVSKDSDAVEFRAKLSQENRRYHDQMLKNMDKAVRDMELLSSKPSHQVNKWTVQGCPSQSNDMLGNQQDNALIGGWKDDALEGGEGDDTLIGGNGSDILIGGTGDDTLYGEDGNDMMMGNSGWDVFIPGPGADLVDGGPGRDAVLYRGDHETGQGVYVNLLTGQGRHADAEGDVLKDVETVIGTIYSDILVGGYESSLLKGSDGNDTLVSTGGDYLVGGDGSDIYLLAFNHGSVSIDNCAEDEVSDVIYMSSQSVTVSDCQRSSDQLLLTLSEKKQPAVKIALRGWTSDDSECGHLVFVFKDVQKTVETLLLECDMSPTTKTPLKVDADYEDLISSLISSNLITPLLQLVSQLRHLLFG